MTAAGGRRSRRWAAVMLVGIVILAVASFLVGRDLQSPASVVEAAAAPPPSLITAVVTQQALVQRLTGTATTSQVPAASVPLASAAPDDSQPVVTGSPLQPGATVDEGDILLEVSGTPILALTGAFPSYRPLSIGLSGPDVRQLRAALGRLGQSSHDPEGVFGPDTARALAKVLAARGYPTPVTTVPAGALAYLPTAGLRLSAGPPGVGTRLTDDASLSFAATTPQFTATFPLTDDVLPTAGLPVTLTDPAGTVTSATVGGVDAPTIDDSGRRTIAVRVTVVDPVTISPATEWSAAIDITVAPADSLIVPSTAVFSRDLDRTVVQVVGSGDTTMDVEVHVIAERAGSAAITPVTSDTIRVGTRVSVGRQ